MEPADPTPRRFVIVGAGAIGGTVGGLLAAAGRDVALVARGAHGAALAALGLRLRTPGGEHVLRLPVASAPREVAWRAGDLAVLAVKLQDAEGALDALLAAAGPGLPALCLQNGLAGERLAAARLERVLGSVSWLLCSHLEPGVVDSFGEPAPGVLDLAAVTPAAAPLLEPVCAALRAAGLLATAVPDLAPLKWAKLLTNLGNVVQVLHPDPAEGQAVARAALAEGEEVLRAAGVAFEPVAAFVAARAARAREGRIAGASRGGGSTWQSHARGQPLETEHLNGEVVRLAASIGRDAPVNRRLLAAARRPRGS